MRIITLILFVCLQSVAGIAQRNLSKALQHSLFTRVYRLNTNEAKRLTATHLREIGDKYLHTHVDSFLVGGEPPDLENGNYLFLHANGNKINYKLHVEGDVEVKFISNLHDLYVYVHDKQGGIIREAKVTVGERLLSFDEAMGAYGPVRRKKSGRAEVIYQNVFYSFPVVISRPYRRNLAVWLKNKNFFHRNYGYYRYFNQPTRYEKKFKGFLVFNKPKYKPGDTVRIKAFIERKNGSLINKPLILRLSDEVFSVDTVLAAVSPYRRGGYEFQFALTDTLDLLLDDEYLLTFEEERSLKYDLDEYMGDLDEDEYAARRKVVRRGKFYFEDYELDQVAFSARTDRKEHSRNIEASVFLKAVDENNLPVLDGRVEVLVAPIKEDNIFYHDRNVFLGDTLWHHTELLEPVGETKITIPDSIFPKASFNYKVECNFLNSNNEVQTRTFQLHFNNDQHLVDFREDRDSLFINYFFLGTNKPLSGTLYIYNKDDDTIDRRPLSLPATVKIRSFGWRYKFESDSVDASHLIKQDKKLITYHYDRTADSVNIEVENEYKLQFWHTIFAGDKVISRGRSRSLSFHEQSKTKKNYFLSVQYVFGGKFYDDNFTIPYQDKVLNIRIDQPERVLPGQDAKLAIHVTDNKGAPVPNADLTAYAVTSKFSSTAPNVPYLGKVYRFRRPVMFVEGGELKKLEVERRLDWLRWSRELGLDTMEYYHFLHPRPIYTNTEKANDNITQIAPYVVSKGDVQPVHLLYIDELPVYFSQSQHLKRYSFPVSAGRHTIRMRLYNKMVTVDSVFVQEGRKTFLSVDPDFLTDGVSVSEMPKTLTEREVELWKKYMILVEDNANPNYAYLRQKDNIYLLNSESRYHPKYILTGPLVNDHARYTVKGLFSQYFQPEGSWQYSISKGLIKQKWYEKRMPFNIYLPFGGAGVNLRDYVITEDELDSLWHDYLDRRSNTQSLFFISNETAKGVGNLRIGFSDTFCCERPFIKSVILFKMDNADFIKVYAGETRNLGNHSGGDYRILILLKEGRYFMVDNVRIKPNGINYYSMDPYRVLPKDNASDSIERIINDRGSIQDNSEEDLNRISTTFNAKYFDESVLTSYAYGQVVDKDEGPVPGATVLLKGTSVGTVTNGDGWFGMKVPPHGKLLVSAVGFESKEMNIQDDGSYRIVLKQMTNELQEVVVTAYGMRSKRNLSGSIFNTTEGYLSGAAAGVAIRIRGASSMSNAYISMPLVPVAPRDVDYFGISSNSIRRNFNDNAYWLPRLTTDANGDATVTTRFPDDITSWNTYVIAMADKKRSGLHQGRILSYRNISGNISLPTFAIEGDRINIIGKTFSYLSDSVSMTRRFYANDHLQVDSKIYFKNSWIDTLSVMVDGKDSLKVKYLIERTDGYRDGEERSVPVYKPGVLETAGVFAALNGDTAFKWAPASDTGTVEVYAEASLLPVLEQEMEHVRHYEYLCNEQLASKLKTMLAQKRVRKYLGQPFKGEGEIFDLIKKLNQNKSAAGLWGWWPGNEPSLWITLHVIEALMRAQKDGYNVSINKQVVNDYLLYNLESYNGEDKLRCVALLHTLQSKADLKKYIGVVENGGDAKNLYARLSLVALKQEVGLPVRIDTFLSKASKTAFGNTYWGTEGISFFDNSIHNTLLMYRILRAAGGYETILQSIRNYFLEKRKSGHWRNTYESSLILETILPDLLSETSTVEPASLEIYGNDSMLVGKFPFHRQVKNLDSLKIVKRGALPVYFTAYQQHWNRDPAANSGVFTVNSHFESNGQRLAALTAGKFATMTVKVSVAADADYVMIEIPIPAGCSYADKKQSLLSGEVHREYFRNKVSIFCNSLAKGEYRFDIRLLPRYTGVYHLNPAKAEMMYFPVFYGREEMKKVTIQPGGKKN